MNFTTDDRILNVTMGRKAAPVPVKEPEDPTAWILDNGFAEFVLMHTNEIVSNCNLNVFWSAGTMVVSETCWS